VSDFKPDIWRLQAQFDTQGLVDALKNDDNGIRRRAAAALRALGAVEAIPAIEHVLDKEPDPETRANLLTALATLQQEQERLREETGQTPDDTPITEVDRLIATLRRGDDDETVIEAAQALGERGSKVAVVPLVMRFNDPSTPIKVRLAVAEVLLELESAPVEVALLGALRSDEWRVRRNAAAILGQLRAEWAIEPLSRALLDDHEVIRKTAFAALRNIGTPAAYESLKQARELLKAKQQAEKQREAEPSEKAAPPKAETPEEEPANTFTDDPQAQSIEGPKRNPPPNDETQKIVWPRRQRKDKKPPEANPTLAPTRPLDPDTLKRSQHFKEQRERSDNEE